MSHGFRNCIISLVKISLDHIQNLPLDPAATFNFKATSQVCPSDRMPLTWLPHRVSETRESWTTR